MNTMHLYWTMMEAALAVAIAVSIILAAFAERNPGRTLAIMPVAMPTAAAVIMAAPFLLMGVDGGWWQGSGPRTFGGTAFFDIMPVVIAAAVLAGAVLRRRRRTGTDTRGIMSMHLDPRQTLDRRTYAHALIRVGLLFGTVALWTGMAGIFYVDSEPGGPRQEGSDAHTVMVMQWVVTGLAAGVILAMQRLRETAVSPLWALVLPLCAIGGLMASGAFGTPWPLLIGCAAYLMPAFAPRRRIEESAPDV